jgi:hypothetical protein
MLMLSGAEVRGGEVDPLWNPEEVVYEGYFNSDVRETSPATTYRNDAEDGLPRFRVGPVPIRIRSDQLLRIVLLLANDSSDSQPTTGYVFDGPYEPFHLNWARPEALRVALGVGRTPPFYDLGGLIQRMLDASAWLARFLPGAGYPQRLCYGLYHAAVYDFEGTDLIRLTQNADRTSYVNGGDTTPGPWDGCGRRPVTFWTVRIARSEAPFPDPRTCTPDGFEPVEGADPRTWLGLWGDELNLEASRVTASVQNDGIPLLRVAAQEWVPSLLGTQLVASGAAPGRIVTQLLSLPGYEEPIYASNDGTAFCSVCVKPSSRNRALIPTYQTRRGSFAPIPTSGDVLPLSNDVILKLYRETCAEGGNGRLRMRYLRFEKARGQASVETDVMLQVTRPSPR